MNKQEAKERAEKLRKLIDYHRNLYHVFDSSEIPDEAFDTIKNELEELENKYPDLVTPESSNQKVGGSPLEKFEKVEHEKPMLSFNDAFSEEEMNEWFERLENFLGHKVSGNKSALFYGELKIDGLAIELIYENGIFIKGATRGDGKIGEDVTQNLKTAKDIPSKLVQLGKHKIPKRLVVRGEVFISKKELENINKEQEKKGLKPFANPRNLAAGSIRQLDPKIAEARKLRSFVYDIVSDAGQKEHEDEHKILASWGFPINPHNKHLKDMRGVFDFRNYWEKKRNNLEYEIDGIVVIINNNSVFENAGVIGKAPRAAIAYKFSPRQATTIVENIEVQVGRTGVLTPVAVLRPVEVGGVTISHATLHNFDEIKRLDVKIGDTVIVTRSGDVIPKIIRVFKELRPKSAKEFLQPKKCPVDGSLIVKDGVLVKCSNPYCGAQNRNRIIHFASRGAFNIRGMGGKIIDRFLDEGLMSDASDIFFLKEGDVASLERFGKKSTNNLINEINKSKTIQLDKFLYALGILHVGEEMSRSLAKTIQKNLKVVNIKNIVKFFSGISVENLMEIPDVGEKVAQSIKTWFREKRNVEFMEKLDASSLKFVPIKIKKSGIFSGMNIVLTGTMSISRQRAKEIIESEGGNVQSDVLKNTNLVIAGENPGSKYNRAIKSKIKIIGEKDFLKKIKSRR